VWINFLKNGAIILKRRLNKKFKFYEKKAFVAGIYILIFCVLFGSTNFLLNIQEKIKAEAEKPQFSVLGDVDLSKTNIDKKK